MAQDWARWVPAYYNDYVQKAGSLGLSPLSRKDWAKKYFNVEETDATGNTEGWAPWVKADGTFSSWDSAYTKDIIAQGVQKYNTKLDELAKYTGKKPNYLGSGTTLDDLSNAMSTIDREIQYAKDNAPEEAPVYDFQKDWETNTEWQKIEELAKSKLEEKAPEMSPELVTEWEKKLDPAFQRQKDAATTNAKNVFAMLFPQGGGLTYEAGKLQKVLQDIDLEKLNKALAFADVEAGRKYSTWEAERATAQNQLFGIGQFKANAGQFKSSQEAANFWNTVAQDWTEKSYYDTQRFQNQQFEKEKALAVELAKIYQNANQSDPWMDMAKNILGGASQGLTYGLVAGRR